MKVDAENTRVAAAKDAAPGRLADRTLDILEAAGAAGVASLPDLARRCGLALPTVHRLAASLIARGYLIAYRRGEYGLGPASLRLGEGLSLRDMLRRVSMLELRSLARQCRSYVHLGVFEGDMVTYLAKVRHGRSELPTVEDTQLEAYCSGLGKVLLAQLDPAELDRYLGQGALIALTPHTITDPDRLRAALDEVRLRGWATDMRELFPDLSCIAVPVMDDAGHAIAAVSVSLGGPDQDEASLRSLLPALREAAGRITAKLYAWRR